MAPGRTTRFPDEVASILGYYVYLYVDPRSSEVFYIGKGVGNRAFDHLWEVGESSKIARLRELSEAVGL